MTQVVTCPYGTCTMRNLCRSYCVRQEFARNGYVQKDGHVVKKEEDDK